MARYVTSSVTHSSVLTTGEVGQMESQDYAKKAFQWAKALRLLDPSIKLISCGGLSTHFAQIETF